MSGSGARRRHAGRLTCLVSNHEVHAEENKRQLDEMEVNTALKIMQGD